MKCGCRVDNKARRLDETSEGRGTQRDVKRARPEPRGSREDEAALWKFLISRKVK